MNGRRTQAERRKAKDCRRARRAEGRICIGRRAGVVVVFGARRSGLEGIENVWGLSRRLRCGCKRRCGKIEIL
jgi:hypothetical protein